MLVPSDPVKCPDGTYFNEKHTNPRCDPISEAPADYCSPLCNPCETHCTGVGVTTPHPSDCSKYYVCLADGNTIEVACPSDTEYFDYHLGKCSTNKNTCFKFCDTCLPHCTLNNERVKDPLDCHSFYLCNPPSMSHFTCNPDSVFDPEQGVCSPGECTNECESVQL